jgi:hypothetical protein
MLRNKTEALVFLIPTLLLILSISIITSGFEFNFSFSPTGFILANAENITASDASSAINQAEKDIKELKEVNFTTTYLGDLLIDATTHFDQSNYAASFSRSTEISFRKNWAYNISDAIRALEIIIDSSEIDTVEARVLIEKAKESFLSERYEEAEKYIEQTHSHINEEEARNTIIEARYGALRDNTIDIIKQNWHIISILIIITTIIIAIFYEKIYIEITKRKVLYRKVEENVLITLIKKAQVERFDNGTISQSMYSAKMNSYRNRQQILSTELHTLSDHLRDPPSLFKMIGLKKMIKDVNKIKPDTHEKQITIIDNRKKIKRKKIVKKKAPRKRKTKKKVKIKAKKKTSKPRKRRR